MGLFDRSSSTTNLTEQTDARQVGISDVEGPVVIADGAAVTVSDQGAIEASRDIALESIRAGTAGLEEVVGLAGDVVAGGRAQNLAQLEATERLNTRFLEGTENVLDRSLDFAGDTVAQTIGVIQDAGRDFVGFVEGVQARESSNTDARLEGLTRTAFIGAGIIAAAALGLVIWKAL